MCPDQLRQSAPLPTHITILYLISVVGSAIADVLVYSTLNHSYEDVDFRDAPSRFGGSIPYFDGVEGFVVYASPANACDTLTSPPQYWENYTGKWFVLISAEGCTFEDKIRAAQDANFDLAIVHNVNSSHVAPMTVENSTGITIPSTFVSAEAGARLRDDYQFMNQYTIVIDDGWFHFGANLNLLIPFIIIVAFFSCPILGYVVVMFIKERRLAARRRLPSSTLRKIPTEKFKKGSPYETCYICISDFVEGEKLRVLLCCHAFHCECIDVWLTRYRRICPTCKRKVYSADEVQSHVYLSDTDSESEADDRTPLIGSSRTRNQGATFSEIRDVRSVIQQFLTMQSEITRPSSSSSSSCSTSAGNEAPSNSNWSTAGDEQSVSTPQLRGLSQFNHPTLAPIVNSINSVEELPAAIGSLPSFSGTRMPHHQQQLSEPSHASISGEGVSTNDATIVSQETSSQSDGSASGLVI